MKHLAKTACHTGSIRIQPEECCCIHPHWSRIRVVSVL